MDFVIAIAAFLVLIGIVITIHEGGHFYIGKLCGIKMLEFSIGFGKVIYKRKFTKDDTLFTLRAIPLGGFVKPLDKEAISEAEWNNLSAEDKNRSFSMSSRWKKFLMVLAGPMANFVLAFLIYMFANMFIGEKLISPEISEVPKSSPLYNLLAEGDVITEINGKKVNSVIDAHPYFINSLINKEKVTFKINNNKTIVADYTDIDLMGLEDGDYGKYLGFYFSSNKGDIKIDGFTPDGIAEKNGLRKNDVVLKINNIKVRDSLKLIREIHRNANKEITLLVNRQGESIELKMIPVEVEEKGVKSGRIGASFGLENEEKHAYLKYGLIDSVNKSYHKLTSNLYTTLVSFKRLISGELSVKSISGPVTIADYSGKSAQKGLYAYILMIAAISIALGVFNLLPVPTLDGGHLLQYIVEYTIGREIPQSIINNVQYVGIFLVVSLMGFSLINDILKYLGIAIL